MLIDKNVIKLIHLLTDEDKYFTLKDKDLIFKYILKLISILDK